MDCTEFVMEWINTIFDDLSEVVIEDDKRYPYGKKVTDFTDDYVIVFYDIEKERVKYLFKKK